MANRIQIWPKEPNNVPQTSQKTAIITGASSGFGKATAEKLVSHGWTVIALARRFAKLEALQQHLGSDKCHILGFDVTQSKDIEGLLEYLHSHQLVPDLLVNNAGLALGLESADQASLDDWQTMVDTNIVGLLRLTRTILPVMVQRKSGHIINVSSIAGSYAYPGGNVYGASKAFVTQFSLNLRADLAGSGVRVTNIEPGLAETEFSLVRFHGDVEKAKKVYQDNQPLTAEDIAESIFWSASLPAHVNINRIELMPTCQSFSPFKITPRS